MLSDIKTFEKDKYLRKGGHETLNYFLSSDATRKIYIAGHRGMVGSACWRVLISQGYTNIIGKTSKELDLRGSKCG